MLKIRYASCLLFSAGVMLISTVGYGATKSTLCAFDHGPRAGETQDYAPMAPLPVGTPCQDGVASTGRVVAPERVSPVDPPDDDPQAPGDEPQSPGDEPPAHGGGMSTLCAFDRGPRAGETQDYAPMAPLPVGTPCQDGARSSGKVVAGGGTPRPRSRARGREVSTLCRFDRGPRAGETEDYASEAPLPVGRSCRDGEGSSGKVVAPASSTKKAGAARRSSRKGSTGSAGASSTLCRFDDGPRAGETQDYAPMAPLPVGTPCQDGRSSTGKVVAAQDSSE